MDTQTDALFDTPTVWRTSRSLAHHHDCTLNGIKERCGGACCRGGGWPASSGRALGHTACAMLGDAGCTFRPEDKPVTCLLYPLRLYRGDMLDMHHRARYPKNWCHGNYGRGPMVVDALRDNLIALFGVEQVDALRVDVVAGRQGRLYPSPQLLAQMAREAGLEEAGVVPHPRSFPLEGPHPPWAPPAPPVPGRVYLPITPVVQGGQP